MMYTSNGLRLNRNSNVLGETKWLIVSKVREFAKIDMIATLSFDNFMS